METLIAGILSLTMTAQPVEPDAKLVAMFEMGGELYAFHLDTLPMNECREFEGVLDGSIEVWGGVLSGPIVYTCEVE